MHSTAHTPTIGLKAPASSTQAPATLASSFVTQDQFNAGLTALNNSLRELVFQDISTPGSLPATGGYTNAIALTNRIDSLDNVTISNATVNGVSGLSPSDIPALNYLSLAGGSLAGNLLINGNATTTGASYFSGNVGIGTSTSQDALSVNGSTFLPNVTPPTITANRLYATAGNLYWAGNLLAGATTGNWTSNGTDAWRAAGNVGIGTTSPFTALSVTGNGYFTGGLTAASINTVNGTTTNATSTTLFASVANFTNAVATTFNVSVANLVGLTATNSTTTNATTTTLYAASATIPSVSATNAIVTNVNATNATTTSFGINGQTFTNLLGSGLNNTAGALSVSLAPFSTSNLTEGSNLYFTVNRVASLISGTTTDALAEGTTNKYFTNARAQSAISVSGSPLTYSSGVLGINQGSGSQAGYLASSDWTTFNNKVASTSLSGTGPITYNPSTGAIGLDLTHPNTWSGAQTFANVTATNATSTSLYITGITSKLLKTDANGQVAPAIAGSDYQAPITTGNLTTGSNLSISGGSSAVLGSGASISLGSNVVTGATNDTNVTGSIAGNNLTLGWTGILGVGRGGTGIGSPIAAGVLLGNYTGTSYQQLATSSLGLLSTNVAEGTNLYFTNARAQSAISVSGTPLTYSGGILGINQASGSQSGYLSASDWTNFNLKLASSSLATSALLAGLVTDHTGSGSLVFGTSPTIAGTPVFSGGALNYSVSSTSTIPDNTPNAWTLATSSSASPLIQVDTNSGGTVSVGQASAAGSSVVLGAISEPANLIFAASSTIEGGGTGQLLTIGANSDVINFGVNVGIGTTTPATPLSIDSTSTTGTILRISNSSVGGHMWDLLSTGSGNTEGAGRLDFYDKTSGAARLSITSTGNVGIGTTTPGSIFSVAGVGNWTAATSTFYGSGGINIKGGCFAINGACIGGGGGSGTNYFTLSGGSIYNNTGTNVGINNTSPSYALDVGGFINTDGTSGGYKIGGNTVLYASSTISAVFGGQGAGAGIISSATSSSNTSSAFATAFGFQALGNATSSGYHSTAVGYQALKGSATVSGAGSNSALGYEALGANTSGFSDSAFGAGALLSNTTGHNDVGAGVNALLQNTTGSNNSAFGVNALLNQTTGSDNMGIGFNTLLDNITGGFNTAIGYQALMGNTSATNTVAIGGNSGYGNGSTYYNQGGTYLGYQTGYNVTTGSDYNTLLGFQSGYNLTTGSNNLLLSSATSSNSIANLTTGSQNILIGNNISLPSATASGQLNIGNIIFGTGNTAIGSNVSTGNIGIGTSTPYSRLTVWGPDNTASTSAFLVSNSASSTEFAVLDNGNATLAGNLIQNSDQRLKTNISPLDASSSLAAIKALNPVTFNWIDPAKGSTPQLGFIAQQVLPIFPNLISTTSATDLTPGGTLSLNYIGFIAPMVKSIQQLAQEIADLADSFTTKELTFTRATGDEIDARTLCLQKSDGTNVCVTGDQLAAAISGVNASTPANGTSIPPSGSIPPVIQINGNNPAIVQVGETYSDLGATITGPQGDLNLGITTFFNGTLTSNIVVDTSTVATDTIDYVVADGTGLTATSTRTIIIQPVPTAIGGNATSSNQ